MGIREDAFVVNGEAPTSNCAMYEEFTYCKIPFSKTGSRIIQNKEWTTTFWFCLEADLGWISFDIIQYTILFICAWFFIVGLPVKVLVSPSFSLHIFGIIQYNQILVWMKVLQGESNLIVMDLRIYSSLKKRKYAGFLKEWLYDWKIVYGLYMDWMLAFRETTLEKNHLFM